VDEPAEDTEATELHCGSYPMLALPPDSQEQAASIESRPIRQTGKKTITPTRHRGDGRDQEAECWDEKAEFNEPQVDGKG
jgi:hypothetical protein